MELTFLAKQEFTQYFESCSTIVVIVPSMVVIHSQSNAMKNWKLKFDS